MKLSSMNPAARRLTLMTGEPGTGKSWQAASYCRFGKTLLLDLDQRANSLIQLIKKYPEFGQIEVEEFGPYDFIKLKNRLEFLQHCCDFDVVIIDGLTASSRMIMNYMLELRGTTTRDTKFKAKGVIQLAEIEDYGGESRALSIIMDIGRILPVKHFILTAHLIVTETTGLGEKKKSFSRSLLTGGKKIAAELPGYFDEVYHFRVEGNANVNLPPDFVVYTNHIEEDFAKTALPLPKKIEVTGKFIAPIIEKAIQEITPVVVKPGEVKK